MADRIAITELRVVYDANPTSIEHFNLLTFGQLKLNWTLGIVFGKEITIGDCS